MSIPGFHAKNFAIQSQSGWYACYTLNWRVSLIMANAPVFYPYLDGSLASGHDVFPRNIVQQPGGQIYRSAIGGLTAHSGGGQTSALPLTSAFNQVTTVAAGGDSVLLPPAVVGLSVIVNNLAASNSLDVYPSSATQGGISGGDSINALSVNAEFSVAADKTAMFFCIVAGFWCAILTA